MNTCIDVERNWTGERQTKIHRISFVCGDKHQLKRPENVSISFAYFEKDKGIKKRIANPATAQIKNEFSLSKCNLFFVFVFCYYCVRVWFHFCVRQSNYSQVCSIFRLLYSFFYISIYTHFLSLRLRVSYSLSCEPICYTEI